MRSRWKKVVATLSALIVAVAIVFAFAFPHAYDTTLLLADLARIELPLPDIRPATTRLETQFSQWEQTYSADVYLPGENARAGLVLVPGAAEGGRRDPRLIEFAEALARSQFAVIVPDILSLRELRLSPDNAVEIAAAVSYLRDSRLLQPAARIGVGAFSVAAGPAVIAALDAESGRHIDFLLLVGGYHDLERTLTYLTTGYFKTDHQRIYRKPNTYGKWVYALSNASRMPDPAAQSTLRSLARRKLADPAADVSDLLPQLGPAGRNVYAFITNSEPERVPALIRAMPPAIRSDIDDLNLAHRDLSGLRARFILVHGLDDDIIPYSESIALKAALSPGQADLYLLRGLHHVDRDVHGLDVWRMWRALRALMAQRVAARP